MLVFLIYLSLSTYNNRHRQAHSKHQAIYVLNE